MDLTLLRCVAGHVSGGFLKHLVGRWGEEINLLLERIYKMPLQHPTNPPLPPHIPLRFVCKTEAYHKICRNRAVTHPTESLGVFFFVCFGFVLIIHGFNL